MKILEDIKYIKQIKENENLNQIVKKLPDNENVCKEILKDLKNENVIIETSKVENSNTSLYLVLSDKIIIGNMEENFTRIQTIAHECIHSIQNRKMLLTNFFLSNIIQLLFVVFIILTFFIKQDIVRLVLLSCFIVISLIHFLIRNSLEKDAMLRAKEVAINYMKKTNKLSEKEIKLLDEEYEKINQIGVPIYRYNLMMKASVKIIILIILNMLNIFF